MNAGEFSVLFLGLVALSVFTYWHLTTSRHLARLDHLRVRVHVNGIRGKSSVVRLVAGILREGGYPTLAKTTGSAARLIGPHGEESVIHRNGAATINEQLDVVRDHVDDRIDALVVECMAVRPQYQAYSQDYMVRSDITVITNVRQDHQEEMGETLEEITDSLALTIPRAGVVVTAEQRPELRARLARHAAARGSRLVYADPEQVLDEDMAGFEYLEFKGNVAIGLAVAGLLGIERDVALRGMWKAVPDVGVVRLRTYDIAGKKVLWVPLFAANDRESVLSTLALIRPHFPPGATVVGILNNRVDRGRRAALFAELVPRELSSYLDHVITFGAYEEPVTARMVAGGVPRERIHNLGDSTAPTLKEVLTTIARLIEGERGVVIGMVNIHTAQAEMLTAHLALLLGDQADDELEDSRDPARLPLGSQRLRRAAGHRNGASRA
jgi:gamma-polyglutamate synthase